MRSATRVLLGALALVLVAGSARAQNDVTFQVDMNPYITSCQHVPATDDMQIRGNIFGWDDSAPEMTDNGDGTYSYTASLAEGTAVSYKFFSTGVLAYEDQTGDRSYTVTAEPSQTLPLVVFADGTPEDICDVEPPDGEPTNYALTFAVDMSVQIGRGAFNPATQEVAVAGAFTDWATSPLVLSEDSGTSGLYAGSIDVDGLLTPGGQQFKFIIRNIGSTDVATWEIVDPSVTSPVEGGNRVFVLTGDEPDTDGDGRLETFYDNNGNPEDLPFFSDADASQFLTGPATVIFNVDARSAQYYLAANPTTGLPNGGATEINSIGINGPAMGESQEDEGPAGGLGDWPGWSGVLNNAPERQLTNNGDNQWSITLNYAAGARRALVAKFGINGDDNESGFGGDHILPITEGTHTYNLSFGCVRQADGTFIDETGDGAFTFYDEYLVIRNDLNPATCTTVTSGGVAGDVMTVANENAPQIAGLAIGSAYPNPVAGRSAVDLTLDRAMDVSVRLFDVTGREVMTLAEGALAAGRTALAVDGRTLAPGVYVLRVEADGQAVSRRLTVVR